MKLVIAEKPSLAKAIRDAVGKDYTVTNAFGHIFELAPPDDYLPDDVPRNAKGQKKWREQDLPIVPRVWKRLPKPDAQEQIKKIRDLLKTATEVVNAGDPDREGQLLIDEILQECGYKGKVTRVWLTSLQPEAISAAFAQRKPNSEYKSLSDSADARARADWLVGMNLTRAWTLRNGGLISVGRVQTPTLKLVVDRDLSIEAFKPVDFYTVTARVECADCTPAVKVTWQPASTDGAGFDAEGRLLDKSVADAVARKAIGAAVVSEYRADKKSRAAPLPFDLTSLQKAASSKHGMSAQQVLDTAQSLYEKKITSYPRSDCRYLGEDQLNDLRRVAAALAPRFSVDIDASLKHAAFDASKVGAHTAIVPTGAAADALSGNEKLLFDMIARATVALFLPAEEYLAVSLAVVCNDETFSATGKRVTVPGWTMLYGKDDDEEQQAQLPALVRGAQVTLTGGAVESKQTKPAARFTDGSLVDAMSNVHKFVTDPAARAKLKETSGIGTVATRANVLETLLKRGWIEKKGKQLVSTADGRAVIKALPDELTSPATTARWEDALGAVAAGTLPVEKFDAAVVAMLGEQIALASKASRITEQQPRAPGGKTAKCPVCGKNAVQLESRKKPGSFFWKCENGEHGLLGDEKGKPGKEFGK